MNKSNYYSVENRCKNCATKVGKIGLVTNLLLAAIKIIIGTLFFSTALLADALYSILDVGFSILIIVGIGLSGKPPDKKHGYGHGKIEFIITLIFSVFTLTGAVCLFVFTLYELHEGLLAGVSKYVFAAAAISSVANYIFYKYSDCVANQYHSPSIRSLSMHSKADAISSMLVAISIIFAFQGYDNIGPYVAIIETAHILVIGIEIFKRSLNGLLDASISQEDIIFIKSLLNSMSDIKKINYVKSRKIGQKVWLNISIKVPGSLNINRVDTIKYNINSAINEKISHIENILVNIIPYKDDENRRKETILINSEKNSDIQTVEVTN